MRQRRLRRVERAFDVDCDDATEVLDSHVADEFGVGDAGVRNDGIDAAKAFAGAFNGAAHRRAVGHVDFERHRAVADGLRVLAQAFAFEADEADGIALLGESSSDASADAARGAGDDGDFFMLRHRV